MLKLVVCGITRVEFDPSIMSSVGVLCCCGETRDDILGSPLEYLRTVALRLLFVSSWGARGLVVCEIPGNVLGAYLVNKKGRNTARHEEGGLVA